MRKLITAAAVIFSLTLLASCGDDEPDPLATPEPTPATEEDKAVAAAEDLVQQLNELTPKIQSGETPISELDPLLMGTGLVNIKFEIEEPGRQGFTYDGERKVESLETVSVDIQSEYPTVVLRECADVTGVTVFKNGVESTEERAPRVIITYTIAQENGAWKINGRDIEVGESC